MKNCLLALLLLITSACYAQSAQDACLKALALKGLNKFSGKTFVLKTENELPCVGDCICKCKYVAPDGGSASLRISTDAGRKEYKMILGMATNGKAVAASDWLYAFYDINNSNPGKPQMSLTVHSKGKTYNAYVDVCRTEEETKSFLIEVVMRAEGSK